MFLLHCFTFDKAELTGFTLSDTPTFGEILYCD